MGTMGKEAGEEMIHHAIADAIPSIDIPALDPSLGAIKITLAALKLICSENPPTEVRILGTDERTIKAKRRKRLSLILQAEAE